MLLLVSLQLGEGALSNKFTITLIVVLGFFVLLFNISSKRQPDADTQKQVNESFTSPAQWEGRYPPDFQLTFMDGTKFKLSEVIGTKLIVLNFFATWCGPCREETPELSAYQGKNRNSPFQLIGIDADEERGDVQKFLDRFNVSYPIGIDQGETIGKQYRLRGYPTTVVIGVDGKVKAYIYGGVSNANVAFDHYLDEARKAIAAGKGIKPDAYLKALAAQKRLPGEKDEEVDKPKDELTGRAARIAREMQCPCGCSQKVNECTCGTSKAIKKRLETMNFTGKTDKEIIRELNAEFCVGNDKS